MKTELMEEQIQLTANEGMFRGLANFNLQFHQCICELIDNSIAAKKDGIPFNIHVIFEKNEKDTVWVYVVDNSKGMTKDDLKDAIQIGNPPKSKNRLNEHGYGLKNALATLTHGEGDWKVWTKDPETGNISSIRSPYANPLILENNDQFPQLPYEIFDISTVIKSEVKIQYIQDVQEGGRPTTDLIKLRLWLMEHLGVIYRAYLMPDMTANTWMPEGQITISIGSNQLIVEPILIPLGAIHPKKFEVELGGITYDLLYTWGTIDEEQRKSKKIDKDNPLKAYYQQNQQTSGIDIRIGKRVIATKVLYHIWKRAPHNDLNDFSGELVIPDTIPRNVLKTVTNKTDFKQDDPGWNTIFEKMREKFPLKSNPRSFTEEQYKQKLEALIKTFVTSPKDIVTREKTVFPMGVKIDVYWKAFKTDEIRIYEVKTGTGTALDLYQLKMYWDGLVEKGEHPMEAFLVCLDYKTPLVEMVGYLNTLKPKDGFNSYNFGLKTLTEMQLYHDGKS